MRDTHVLCDNVNECVSLSSGKSLYAKAGGGTDLVFGLQEECNSLLFNKSTSNTCVLDKGAVNIYYIIMIY